MKRLWSQIAGLPIYIVGQEMSIARIQGIFIHPDTGQIIGFLVGFMKVLVPIDIYQWREDAVIINGKDAVLDYMEIHRLREIGLMRAFFNGKSVFSKFGHSYGRIYDFEMDLFEYKLLTFEAAKSFLFFKWKKRLLHARDIDHITKLRVIVCMEPDQREPAKLNSISKRPRSIIGVS